MAWTVIYQSHHNSVTVQAKSSMKLSKFMHILIPQKLSNGVGFLQGVRNCEKVVAISDIAERGSVYPLPKVRNLTAAEILLAK